MFDKFKKILKKNPFIHSLNALYKARWRSIKLRKLYTYYREKARAMGVRYSREEALEKLRDSLEKRSVNPNKKQLHIFWVGAHYAQDNSGFLQALRKFGEVVVFYNSRGGYGCLGIQYGFSLSEATKLNSEHLLKEVTKTHKTEPIDLLIGQMWADVLDANVLAKIQRMGIPTVNISMDDKLPELWRTERGKRMGSVGLCEGIDLVLTTSPDTCLWYAVESCPAIYWPLASDPDVFYPWQEKIYDVVFVGAKYGLRGKLVEAIIRAGVKVEAFGPGWPNGSVGAEKMAEVFGKAKIILGTGNIGYNRDIMTIKLRDFDAPMSGALYITHRNLDLLQLFEEGKEIECYDTFEECVRKIKFYLVSPEKLETVAKAGLKKARENYTWEKNISGVLEVLGFQKVGS